MLGPWKLFSLRAVPQAIHALYPESDATLTLAERPERIIATWAPLERLLTKFLASGEVEEVDGQVVLYEGNAAQEVVPAMLGIFDLYDLAASRHKITADLGPLRTLCTKFLDASPIYEDEIVRALQCIQHCKRAIADLTVEEAVSLVKDTIIRAELEAKLGTELEAA